MGKRLQNMTSLAQSETERQTSVVEESSGKTSLERVSGIGSEGGAAWEKGECLRGSNVTKTSLVELKGDRQTD